MISVAVVGLGKMGLSHLAIVRPHPGVNVVGVCDTSAIVLGVLRKYAGLRTFSDLQTMLDETKPDALIIATPSHLHAGMVRQALERGIHVFCEKPLFLDSTHGEELTALARDRGLVTQVGYHNKFVGAFSEVKRLLDAGAIGIVTNALAEAYGPVVLKPTGLTWRSQRSTGGGCLYDYAAHPVDLLVWYLGEPTRARGSSLTSIFSRDIEDSVASTMYFGSDVAGQLCVNWSDESQRKMTTKVTLWGTQGRIYADRQEIRVYLRDPALAPDGYERGWNVKYTTELTPAPWFYLRGEEYSEQLDTFVRRVEEGERDGLNTFETATMTDRAIAMIVADAAEMRAEPTRMSGLDGEAPNGRHLSCTSRARRRTPGGSKSSAILADPARRMARALLPRVRRAAIIVRTRLRKGATS